MLSIAALKGGQGNYYLALSQDDYYLKGGEPPGRWYGEGARSLGLTGQVEPEHFRNLLRGLSPDGTTPLVQIQHHEGKTAHVSGGNALSMTQKTAIWVSTLEALGDKGVREEIREARQEAVNKALDYLEDVAAETRRGKGGREREKVGLIVAAFEHSTSRAVGDSVPAPHGHTHCIVVNIGLRADGTTGTILSQPLFAHKMAAGAIYRAELS